MTESDLVYYGPANIPDDVVSTAAGAMAVAIRPIDSPLASTQELEVVSDNAADTMNITIERRLAGGALQSDAVALNGLTPVAIPNGPNERVLLGTLALAAAGTVTLRVAGAGATVHTFAAGELQCYRLFRKTQASASVGNTTHELVYVRNTSVDTLLTALSQLQGGDPNAIYMHGIALAKGDQGTLGSRATVPAGVVFVDDAVDQPVPGVDLAGSEHIGIYIRQDLGVSQAAGKELPVLAMSGTSSV